MCSRVVALALLTWLFAAAAFGYTQDLVPATDINPDPDIVEVNMTADEATVDVDGDGSPDNVFAFNGVVPGPLIEAKVGDTVIIHYTNNLDSLASTIHWHGIQVNNESDGTQVSQDEVPPAGGTYTYQFVLAHPGIAWYHPHIMPTDQTFRGLYGALVVSDPADDALVSGGVLPPAANTKVVVLSDTTVCEGDEVGGVCAEANCGPAGGQACGAGDIPFVQPDFDCRLVGGAGACAVALGTSTLINGVPLEPTDSLTVTNGEGVRLQIINAAIQRYFRLEPPVGGTLYRVGGEGGLLDSVRVEGGVKGSWNTLYNEGEILLPPGARADVVFVPTGLDQATREIRATAFGNTGGSQVVLRFTLDGPPSGSPYEIAVDDPLRDHALVMDPVEVLPASGFASLADPTQLSGSPLGTDEAVITFDAPVTTLCQSDDECHPGTQCIDMPGGNLSCPDQSTSPDCACVDDGAGPGVNEVRGIFDAATAVSFTDVPHLQSSRYAFVGDLLELSLRNNTNNHHPFHLHGFEYQPVRVVENDSDTLYTYDYAEFRDNVNVHPGQTLVFRVRLDDRPKWDDVLSGEGSGGALGRWLLHCHIFHHAGLGMISELVVLDPDVFADGFESGDTSGWSATVN